MATLFDLNGPDMNRPCVSRVSIKRIDREDPSFEGVGNIGQPLFVENITRSAVTVWITETNEDGAITAQPYPRLINPGRSYTFGVDHNRRLKVSLITPGMSEKVRLELVGRGMSATYFCLAAS